jgi:hypothetical protein
MTLLNKRIVHLIEKGQKIEAIRLYKDETHCSLIEAKTHVESLIDEKYFSWQITVDENGVVIDDPHGVVAKVIDLPD